MMDGIMALFGRFGMGPSRVRIHRGSRFVNEAKCPLYMHSSVYLLR